MCYRTLDNVSEGTHCPLDLFIFCLRYIFSVFSDLKAWSHLHLQQDKICRFASRAPYSQRRFQITLANPICTGGAFVLCASIGRPGVPRLHTRSRYYYPGPCRWPCFCAARCFCRCYCWRPVMTVYGACGMRASPPYNPTMMVGRRATCEKKSSRSLIYKGCNKSTVMSPLHVHVLYRTGLLFLRILLYNKSD